MTLTRLFSSAAIVMALSTPAFAQTSDAKTTQSNAASQPAQAKNLKAPASEVVPNTNTYRSNRSTGTGITNKEVGCVTEAGAKDMDCNGVADMDEAAAKKVQVYNK